MKMVCRIFQQFLRHFSISFMGHICLQFVRRVGAPLRGGSAPNFRQQSPVPRTRLAVHLGRVRFPAPELAPERDLGPARADAGRAVADGAGGDPGAEGGG